MFSKALALFAASAYAAETLIFQDDFNTFDLKRWKHEITMGGGGNWEFEIYNNRRQNSWVKDGVLYLQPTLTADAGINLTSGEYAIWGGQPADLCTSNSWWGCARTGTSSNIINPIMSARVRTAESFNFTYGRVEVRAKLPKGDWIWPAIWMLPTDQAYGSWPASGEIDIMESRGNSCGNWSSSFGSTLHWGPDWTADPYWMTHAEYTHPNSLGDDFHTYGLFWSPTRLYTYFDDPSHIILDVDMSNQDFYSKGGFNGFNPWQYSGAKNAPFDQDFYLIFNVAVGGVNGYFPNNQCNKPWSDSSSTAANDFWQKKSTWYPSWNSSTTDSAMKIDSVKVWKLTAGGEEELVQ